MEDAQEKHWLGVPGAGEYSLVCGWEAAGGVIGGAKRELLDAEVSACTEAKRRENLAIAPTLRLKGSGASPFLFFFWFVFFLYKTHQIFATRAFWG
jgi:hypothetical protein